MPGNYTANKGDGFGIRLTTSQREMAAFDMLPPTLRQAVNDAPYSMSSEWVLTYHRDRGWKAALHEIDKSSAGYVGADKWQPMTTAFSSTSSRKGRRASAVRLGARERRNLQRLVPTIPTVDGF
jgi:hypothetical protein